MRVFLSGPITTGCGADESETQRDKRFAAAERIARRRWPGCAVWNPRKQVPRWYSRCKAMRSCSLVILSMEWPDKILMLPGYAASRGSMLEHNLASQIDLDVDYIGDEELEAEL